MVSKEDLIEQTRPLFQEAIEADPEYVEEAMRALFGKTVVCWHMIPLVKLRAFRRALYIVVLEARE